MAVYDVYASWCMMHIVMLSHSSVLFVCLYVYMMYKVMLKKKKHVSFDHVWMCAYGTYCRVRRPQVNPVHCAGDGVQRGDMSH